MFSSWLFRGAVALVVLVAVAIGGWYFFIRDDVDLATQAPAIPADLKATATTTAAAATAAAATAAGGSATAVATAAAGTTKYTIVAARSEAAYFADETLARIGTGSTAKGTTKEITGAFFLKADGLDPATPSTFSVNLVNLKSDESMRDRRVQTTLETNKFPNATFTVTSVTNFPREIPATVDSTPFQIIGTFEVHGVKKEVTWTTTARRDGNVLTALATVKFKYADFGMEPPSIGGFVSVADSITIQMQVVATAGS